jgi:WD40 repeat protein
VGSHRVEVWDWSNPQKPLAYEHSCEVTAAETHQLSLILGDKRGKITLLSGFLQQGVAQLRQQLEWHTHQVLSLAVEGAYLYSAGEEGVVTYWHLKEHRRDFLPRLSAPVTHLRIQEGRVYCHLANNTLKRIDLSQDKAVVEYRVVVQPQVDAMGLPHRQARSNLVRVPALEDRLFLRAQPGRLQEINLGNGFNCEHSLVGRNMVSRLDQHFPCPHALTDLCLSRDGSRMAVVVEGVNTRSLRFYSHDRGQYELVSKVENCHSGSEPVGLLLLGELFVSYSRSDPAVKVWRLTSRRKQSILETEETFWSCDYHISYRDKRPLFVSASSDRLVLTYPHEFILFVTLP